MNFISLLSDKSLGRADKRETIVNALKEKVIAFNDLQPYLSELDDKQITLIVEAMEAITRKNPEMADREWLEFAVQCMDSRSNSLVREASRVIGNIAHLFPDDLGTAIHKLMGNVNNEGTVLRWGSAYALGKMIAIPQHANSELYEVLLNLSEMEIDNGVKNQYLGGLKKAQKLRR